MTIQAEDKTNGRHDKKVTNGFRLGGRIGIGESKLRGTGLSDMTQRLAISGGLAANYQFDNVFSLNTDFLLSSLGAKSSGITKYRDLLGSEYQFSYNDRYDFLFAEIPVTAQLQARSGSFFIRGYIGPSVSFKLLALESREYNSENYDMENGYRARNISDANNVSYSMVYGFGLGAYNSENKIYFLDVRLNTGLSPVAKIQSITNYINYYTISAGYYF